MAVIHFLLAEGYLSAEIHGRCVPSVVLHVYEMWWWMSSYLGTGR
jgi:hypothetical protein